MPAIEAEIGVRAVEPPGVGLLSTTLLVVVVLGERSKPVDLRIPLFEHPAFAWLALLQLAFLQL